LGTVPSDRDESVDGDWTFELHPDRDLIRGRETFVSKFERTVMLESLCPEIDRTWTRHAFFSWGFKVLVGSVAVVYVSWRLLELPVSSPWVGLPLAGIGTALAVMLFAWRRIEHAVFRNRAGGVEMCVRRFGEHSGNFDEFVRQIQVAVRGCGGPRVPGDAPR